MSEEIPAIIKIFSILPLILMAMRFAGFFDFFSSDSEEETSSAREHSEIDNVFDPTILDNSSKDFKSGLELDPNLKKRLQEKGIMKND